MNGYKIAKGANEERRFPKITIGKILFVIKVRGRAQLFHEVRIFPVYRYSVTAVLPLAAVQLYCVNRASLRPPRRRCIKYRMYFHLLFFLISFPHRQKKTTLYISDLKKKVNSQGKKLSVFFSNFSVTFSLNRPPLTSIDTCLNRNYGKRHT